MTLPNPEQTDPLLARLLDDALAAPDALSPDMLALSQHTLAGTTPLLPRATNQAVNDALAAVFDADHDATSAPAGLAAAVLQQTQNQITQRAQNVNRSRWADTHLHTLLEEALSPTADTAASTQALANRIAAATAPNAAADYTSTDRIHSDDTRAVVGRIGFTNTFAQPRFAMAAGLGLLLLTAGLFAVVASFNPSPTPGPGNQTADTGNSSTSSTGDLDTLVAQAVAPLQSNIAVSDLDDDGYTTADTLSVQLAYIEATPLWASPQDALDTTLTLESIELTEDEHWTVF